MLHLLVDFAKSFLQILLEAAVFFFQSFNTPILCCQKHIFACISALVGDRLALVSWRILRRAQSLNTCAYIRLGIQIGFRDPGCLCNCIEVDWFVLTYQCSNRPIDSIACFLRSMLGMIFHPFHVAFPCHCALPLSLSLRPAACSTLSCAGYSRLALLIGWCVSPVRKKSRMGSNFVSFRWLASTQCA